MFQGSRGVRLARRNGGDKFAHSASTQRGLNRRTAGRCGETCPAMIQIKRGILDEVTSKFSRGQKSEFS
jgi:hypothetical protein